MEFRHIPVMYREVLEGLDVKADGIYVDCTLGGAGHASGILAKLTGNGKLIANDLDEEALENGRKVLAEYADKVTFVHGDYKDLPAELDALGIGEIDGVLIDLGVSSPQIDNAERGFSYVKNAPLDMRMDRTQTLDARAVVNGYPKEELVRVIREYGEDKLASKIAAAIVREREREPIETTERLAGIVEKCYPAAYRYKFGHPAKRVFQAIRIEVNGELDGLYEFIEAITLRLRKGGRIAVITFHSLEDRIVKNAFKELEKDCICDKRLPVCVCGKRQEIKILTPKPVTAGEEELKENRRAESAKLRIAERV